MGMFDWLGRLLRGKKSSSPVKVVKPVPAVPKPAPVVIPPVVVTPAEPVKPSEPVVPVKPSLPVVTPVPVPVKPAETILERNTRWTRLALDISQSFEGETPWANPTGNFDDMGLTMGALGWTIFYGDQQVLVKQFIAKHGKAEMLKLMPKTGTAYYNVANSTTKAGMSAVKSWSSGSKVKEPYRSELVKFWQDPRMVEIQIAKANKDMTPFALEQGERVVTSAKLKELTFDIFAFFFDWRVQNGAAMKDVSYRSAFDACDGNWNAGAKQVLNYCANVSGQAAAPTARKCGSYWEKNCLPTASAHQKILLIMGFQRAKKSRSEYVADVLTRRGTIAMKVGYVHGEFVDLRPIYNKA